MSAKEQALQQGISALNQRRFAEAERAFKKVLRSEPNHVPALNLLTVTLMSTERFAAAQPFIERAISLGNASDASHYNFGLILKRLNKPIQALQQFSEALRINPSVPETWNNRGTVLNDVKRHEEAIFDFDKAILLNPNYSEALANKGKSLAGLERYDEASLVYHKALTLKPDLVEAWLGRGNVLTELKRFDEALTAYDKALAFKPDSAEGWLGRGNVRAQLKRFDLAFAAYDKALALKPDFAEGWLGRGNVFSELKSFDEAFADYDKAIALKPDLADAWLGRGSVFAELKHFDKALAAYDKALVLQPDLAKAWVGRGNVFGELKHFDEAFAAYDKALSIKPGLAEVWLGRGNVFTERKRFDDALAAYDKAIALKPDLAEAWLGHGNIFAERKRFDEAFAAYDKVLALKPGLAEAWLGRGNAFTKLKRFDEAFVAYDRALALKPNLKHAEGARLHAKMHLCDWAKIEEESLHLLSAVREHKPASPPFDLLSIASSPTDQLQCAKAFVADQGSFPTCWRGEIYSHDRIRLAYLSADFHDHATAYLIAGLFEQHDKARFEISAISFGAEQSSGMRRRITDTVEHFIDVQDKTDQQVAELIRELEIDIAVDLKGFTQDARFGVLARRAAPVQVNYLGYPGTLAADYMDYIIADRIIIPREHFNYYTEKVVSLPESYQVNDRERRIAECVPSRTECRLPDKAFVFCCFNNPYKIMPDIFDIWMRLLRARENSVLWLIEGHPTACINLRREAGKRGVSAERLIFAPQTSLSKHLARHRHADLFLDTLPYNAHTTASDALWAGVPVLTCLGTTFAGRVAGSLLNAVGLNELITCSLDDYEALALKLARGSSHLAALKDKLARNKTTHPLFNTERFARHIEAAYTTMWERYQRREAPLAFNVARID